jgi:hypothetical protein
MNELELVALLSMLQVKFPNLEWDLTEDLDWVEVEDYEMICAFIDLTEVDKVCILVGYNKKFTLRIVFEFEEYDQTFKRRELEDKEELLKSLELWLEELKELLKDIPDQQFEKYIPHRMFLNFLKNR